MAVEAHLPRAGINPCPRQMRVVPACIYNEVHRREVTSRKHVCRLFMTGGCVVVVAGVRCGVGKTNPAINSLFTQIDSVRGEHGGGAPHFSGPDGRPIRVRRDDESA
jgi:hypothetical protein